MAKATTFDILPAIDLRGGRVVRLEEGDFERETAFADDPVLVASGFADDGAGWIHVVDLDAARTGRPAHADAIATIIAAVANPTAISPAIRGSPTGSVPSVDHATEHHRLDRRDPAAIGHRAQLAFAAQQAAEDALAARDGFVKGLEPGAERHRVPL